MVFDLDRSISMVRKTLLVSITTFLLSGCQSSNFNTYIVTEESPQFIGKIVPQETIKINKEVQYDYTFNVEDNTFINKDYLFFSYTNYKNDPEYQKLKDKIEYLKSLEQTASRKEELRQLEADLKQFQKPIYYYAPIAGYTSITGENIYITSDKMHFEMELSENELRLFKQTKEYQIFDREEILIDDISVEFKYEYEKESFKIYFPVEISPNYIGETYILKLRDSFIKIPQECIFEQDGKYHVLINNYPHDVDGYYEKSQFIITSGLKDGDVIQCPSSN